MTNNPNFVYEDGRYVYNQTTGQYRDVNTGRFVPQAEITELIQNEIDAGFTRIETLSERLADGRIGLDQFQNAMISHLNYAHDVMYLTGRGGVNAMNDSDYAMLASIKESEFSFLENFMADIENGNLSAGQIRARIGLYNEKAYGSFYEGVRGSAEAQGFDEERRVLNPAEHCDDCTALARRGWQPLGTLPRPTEGSICQANCKCTMEFRASGKPKRKTPVLKPRVV